MRMIVHFGETLPEKIRPEHIISSGLLCVWAVAIFAGMLFCFGIGAATGEPSEYSKKDQKQSMKKSREQGKKKRNQERKAEKKKRKHNKISLCLKASQWQLLSTEAAQNCQCCILDITWEVVLI